MLAKMSKKIILTLSAIMLSTSVYASIGGELFIGTSRDPNTHDFLSRSLYEFHKDGTLTSSNSDQQGDVNLPPFGIQQGYWEEKNDHIHIKSLSFSYPHYFTTDWNTGFEGNQALVVINGHFKEESSHKLKGKIKLWFYALEANINQDSPLSGPIERELVLYKVQKP